MADGTVHLVGRPTNGGPGDVTQDYSGGSAHTLSTGGTGFAPSNNNANITVNNTTGAGKSTQLATGTKKIRVYITSTTDGGALGALWMAYGTDSADAIANVEAGTLGVPAGSLDVDLAADQYKDFEVPATFQDGGWVAFAAVGGAPGTNLYNVRVMQSG